MSVSNYRKYKVLIIGEANVGKTSLLIRHIDGRFNDETTATIGIDFRVKAYTKDYIRRDLHIWDTAGQERFKNITQAYYRGADGVFIVFDLNNIKTFTQLDFWLQRVLAEIDPDKKPIFVLVGNKSDLPRQVPHIEIQEFTKKYNIGSYIEASAKNNNNVSEMFDILLEKLILGEFGTRDASIAGIQLKPNTSIITRKNIGCCVL